MVYENLVPNVKKVANNYRTPAFSLFACFIVVSSVRFKKACT